MLPAKQQGLPPMVVTRYGGHPARIDVRSSRAPSSEPWKRPRNLENRAETIGSERDFPVTRATPRRIRIEGRKTFVPIGSNGHKSLDFARHHWHENPVHFRSISPFGVRHVFLHATVARIADAERKARGCVR